MSSPAQPGSKRKPWKPALWVLTGIIATLLVVVLQGQRAKSATEPATRLAWATAADEFLSIEYATFGDWAVLMLLTSAVIDEVRAPGKVPARYIDLWEGSWEAYRDGRHRGSESPLMAPVYIT